MGLVRAGDRVGADGGWAARRPPAEVVEVAAGLVAR
jgi:hypothetical protein